MDIGPGELIIVLAIVLILFGPGRVAKIGGELGVALHEFRDGLKSGSKKDDAEEDETVTQSS
jgi:sec-independent protein translocase protein TatA